MSSNLRGSRRLFSPEQEQRIARLYERGASTPQLARDFGCSHETIRNTVRRTGGELRPKNLRGTAAHGWKGQRRITQNGYIAVSIPHDHQFGSMLNAAGQVMEHRLVMARHLGRDLRPDETVHHINGDRTDNRIENLQLRVGQHGSGQALRCRSCGSCDVEAVGI